MLERMDSQALRIARMTAGMHGCPSETVVDFDQNSAAMLRATLGRQPLNWKSKLVELQGRLLGHCFRQPLHYSEHAVLTWRMTLDS
eukprot:370636-Amphidinium_carterae.3